MTEDLLMILPRPPVVTIRAAKPSDLPELKEMIALIGYAILVPLYRAQDGERGMDLHQLFVRDGHRGHGIGGHLVARARDHARKAGCDYLSVSAATGNFVAHRFYEHMDFKARPMTGMRYMQSLA